MVNDIFVYNKKMKEKIVSYQFVLLVLGIKPPKASDKLDRCLPLSYQAL